MKSRKQRTASKETTAQDATKRGKLERMGDTLVPPMTEGGRRGPRTHTSSLLSPTCPSSRQEK